MASIRISNIPPYDGEYEFDQDRSFTTRELRWIKQIAGYLPMKLGEGLEGGDADLYIALALIAMNRAGKVDREDVLEVADKLADVPFDDSCITFVMGEEADADPPAVTPEPVASLPRSSPSSKRSSGGASSDASETSGETPAPTGLTRLPTSPTSLPMASEK